MNYGHSRNAGHGWRRPTYEWVPSYYPRRRRRRKSRKGRRHARQDWYPSSYRAPSVSLVEALLSYPSLRPKAAGEPLDLDPVRNLVEAACVALGASVVLLFAFWPIAVTLGLVAASVGRILIQTHGVETAVNTVCEQSSRAYRVNRKISVNPPPTAEALEAAWRATRGGRRGDPAVLAARLRLGAMLSDLEPVVDQSYIRDEDGTIVGRQPGLRGWIGFYTPSLLPHYKTLMAYKALADKLRVALEINEPETLDRALELHGERSKISVKSEGERVRKAYREMFGEESGEQFPATMAALEATVRERLGLAWMRRGRRKAEPAA